MTEMVLDSIFLIAHAYIDKHGTLPEKICVRRRRNSRLYHIVRVVDIACEVTGMERPKSLRNIRHVKGTLHKAVCVMNRHRKRSPYYPLTRNPIREVTEEGMVIDLRSATCNVAGLARERLVAVAEGREYTPTKQAAQAAAELLKKADVIAVDSERASHRVQFFLADRGIRALVVFGEAAEALKLPKVEAEWSEPTVDHQ